MAPVTCPPTCKGGVAECAVETCCANVRAIALFEALGGFDRQYLGEREVSDQRIRDAAAKAQKNKVGSVGPRGTGYGMDSHYGGLSYSPSRARGRGRGRGRGRRTSDNVSNGEPSHLDTLAQHFDEIIVRALNTITGYLPAPYADNPQMYDILPHQTIDALLSVSQLPDLLGNLLRNDSVTDWITRIDVYHAMLGLLRRMADCELTLEVFQIVVSLNLGLKFIWWLTGTGRPTMGNVQELWPRRVDVGRRRHHLGTERRYRCLRPSGAPLPALQEAHPTMRSIPCGRIEHARVRRRWRRRCYGNDREGDVAMR